MRKKILVYSITIIILTAVIVALFGYRAAQSNYTIVLEQHLKSLSNVLLDYAQNDGIDTACERVNSLTNTRVTIIAASGDVLVDTQAEKGLEDNHLQREEVKEALDKGEGYASRYSKTKKQNYLYYAKAVDYQGEKFVMRLSLPAANIDSFTRSALLSIILGFIAATLFAFLISLRISKGFIKPLEEMTAHIVGVSKGEHNPPPQIKTGDEIEVLSQSFMHMEETLNTNLIKLHEKNVQIETVINSMDNALIAIDRSGEIILLNSAAQKLFGITSGMGHHFSDFLRERAVKNFLAADFTEDTVEYRHSDLIYRLHKAPLSTGGTVALFDDVTEIKRLENLKSEFVSNVTHELKTPLTSIKGFAETLRTGAIDDHEAAMRFIDIIEIEADRLTSLIDDILTLSSIESSTQTSSGPCNVKEVVNEVFELLSLLASKKEIEFTNSILVEDIRINPLRLKQLLINLLSNALHYTPEKGKVSLSIIRQAHNAIIEVSDTGIGIAKEHIPHLFERFYTVDKGRSRKNGGTGLGLSIVKHIAMLYGGSVSVKSTPGEGSAFTVSLPVIENGGSL